jgi:FlaA1/EpsC-like NDP-sugar epimerase
MPSTAILIGLTETCRRLERQLDLLDERPATIGWVLVGDDAGEPDEGPVLGRIEDLETIAEQHAPDLALLTLPAAMGGLVTAIRTRLRRLGVPDRFMPTLDDQLAGVGPRSLLEVDPGALLDRPPRAIDERAVDAVIRDRIVLITGAGGSIGSELARRAVRYGPRRLVLVDRSENALFEIDRQIARAAPSLPRTALLHDVVDARATFQHFRALQPQVIFHAAAHKHVPMLEDHPGAAVDNNLFGTRSVAEAADAVAAERFVMISTDKAVHPSSIMGATKRLAELSVQDLNGRSGTAFSMVRFGNVLGSAGSVLEIWDRQVAEGGPVTVTDPEMTRYFMTIPEAAALVMQSAALVDPRAPGGEVFVLDMGEPIRVVDLARRFVEALGLRARLPDGSSRAAGPGDLSIVYTGPRPGEKLHEQLAFDAESMRPTRHPDINIWMLPAPDRRYIERMVATLDPATRPAEPAAVAAAIRQLVPEMVEPAVA